MGYKAFSKGMICQGKQYAENAVFEESGADSCCQKGVMHYCETPFDCLDYYPIVDSNADFTEFAEVEPLDKVLAQDNKRATKKLKIGAKLSFNEFIKAGISVLIESTKDIQNGENSSGYGAQIGSSGDRAQIGSSGNWAQIGSSGYKAQIGSSGNYAVVSAIGYKSAIKAKIGSWIVLAEYDKDLKPVCVRAAQIDGEKLKPDTFYTLENGEFTEIEMED